jgi:serine/threonine protein kinase
MVGKTLAHFEILEKIGAGGMGEVFRARDTKLGREVALKTLPPELAADPARLKRFMNEALELPTHALEIRKRMADRPDAGPQDKNRYTSAR